MIDKPFLFPKSAEFGRIIPKNKIYEHGCSSSAIRQFFIDEVDQIRWSYKLAPKTVNLPATPAVKELQVISIALRSSCLDDRVLQSIDKSIPSPILFELTADKKLQYAICYKRRNETAQNKLVISGYFRSDWMSIESERQPLPVSLSIEALYHFFIRSLISLFPKEEETIEALVERAELFQEKQKEAEKLKIKRDREKQFKRRVEINKEYNDLLTEIEAI